MVPGAAVVPGAPVVEVAPRVVSLPRAAPAPAPVVPGARSPSPPDRRLTATSTATNPSTTRASTVSIRPRADGSTTGAGGSGDLGGGAEPDVGCSGSPTPPSPTSAVTPG